MNESPSAPGLSRAELGERLITSWEHLNRMLAASKALPLSPYESRRMSDFTSLFADEIEVARRARNSYVHAKPISEENLAIAVEVCAQLNRILRDAVPALEASLPKAEDQAREAYLNALERVRLVSTQLEARLLPPQPLAPTTLIQPLSPELLSRERELAEAWEAYLEARDNYYNLRVYTEQDRT